MTFIEKARLLASMYQYFRMHPSTATREGYARIVQISIPRKTFIRYVELVRSIYPCSITYNHHSKTYITKELTKRYKQIYKEKISKQMATVRKPYRAGVPIRCIETKQEWEFIKDCAKEINITASYLGDCIRFGEAINGLHYERI